MSWVLAVDFGTSNTSAAHRIGPDRVESLPLSHTSNLMPSSVYIEGPHTMSTGEVAVNQASLDPAGFVAAPKTHVSTGTIPVRGQEIPVATMIAAVLRTVHGQALQRHNNEPPSAVVLTHPEAWSNRELAVLREAASLAGLGGNVSLISEPRAAAFYYSRQHDAKIVKGSTIAVFDFGGGTLDVAVLTATSEWTFEVLRAGGDNALGGKNLDATISRWVDRHLADENPDLAAWLRTPDGLNARRTLDDQIRRAKELLSQAPSATIRISGNGTDMTLTLTRDEFEQLIEPQITRGVALAAAVLRDAGVDPGSLQALYLTGGSSRIPYVHRRLAELGPIATLDDPKTVVAKGAAGFVAGGRTTEPPANLDTEVLRNRPGAALQPHPQVRPQFTGPNPMGAQVGPPAGPDTAASGSGGNRKLVTAVGGGLAVLLVAAGAFFFVTRDDGPGTDTATVAETGGTGGDAVPNAAPAATADSTFISETTDDVTSVIPAKLVTGSSTCEKSGFSGEGALQVRCLISPDSSLGKAIGMERTDYQSVTAWRDDQYARSNFIRLRDNKSDGHTKIVSADGNRIIDFDPDETYYVYFTVIDRSTGAILQFSMDTVDLGMTFLTELELADA